MRTASAGALSPHPSPLDSGTLFIRTLMEYQAGGRATGKGLECRLRPFFLPLPSESLPQITSLASNNHGMKGFIARYYPRLTSVKLYIDSTSVDIHFAPLKSFLESPNPLSAPLPYIHRIDNGSLLAIFHLAMALPHDAPIHEVRDMLPRGYLGLVCAEWHQFCKQNASLWSTIILLPRSLGPNRPFEDSAFATSLTRSRAMPLSIYIFPEAVECGDGNMMYPERDLADALRKASSRIQTLVVDMRWRSSLERLGNVLDPREYPILERLHLNAAIDDVGPPYQSLLTTANVTSRLTSLSINATDLLDLLASTQAPHHALALLTSLTITCITPHSAGFPDDGLDSILHFVHSLFHLITLRIEKFHILGGHPSVRNEPRTRTSPHAVRTLDVRTSNTTAIAYLLRHFAPATLVLEACTFTTTPPLRLPKCVEHLELSHIADEGASSPIFRILSYFNGRRVTFDGCSFLTGKFLMRVLGQARLTLMGTAYPRLRDLHIKNCTRLSTLGLVKFLEVLYEDRQALLDVLEVVGHPVLVPQIRARALSICPRMLLVPSYPGFS
ncbi:hypothetical protein DFP72DRAFT_851509 [Ephemerocybe angulata]|uniref:Uncharacterized protein n=1 Tax=Ephemerocybe angulata TaxID=980116 RepID=A0A8H6M412_9AGAR|nr:hypothetical protein DFP72DRAFT_851509 [Tulosesus angulatus]